MLAIIIPTMLPDIDAISRDENYLTKATVINFIISGSISLIIFEKVKAELQQQFFK